MNAPNRFYESHEDAKSLGQSGKNQEEVDERVEVGVAAHGLPSAPTSLSTGFQGRHDGRTRSIQSHPIESYSVVSRDDREEEGPTLDGVLYTEPSIFIRNQTPSKGLDQDQNKTPQLQTLLAEKVHTPKDPEAFYSPDHKKERQERQIRRDELKPIRQRIEEIPINNLWEIPGRPNVVYAMKDYRRSDVHEGRKAARDELPFLFKAFELGQAPPPRPGTKKADKPRAATIHEYLDWTVTASVPQDPDELDFDGFRVLVLYPRFKLWWPPPSEPYNSEIPLKYPDIGASKPPVPHLQVCNKPISAATVRIGPSWMEVPFYATQELRRNKGNGRALLEAIEDLCRYMKIPRILLCSTDDPKVKGTWSHLGFKFTSKEDLEAMGVTRHDLLHMDNTVQMHKDVPERKPWSSVIIKHGAFKHRLYYIPGGGSAPPVSNEIRNGLYFKHNSIRRGLAPAKKVPSKRRR